MKKVLVLQKKLIKLWSENIEEGALIQLKNLANLPFIFKWICAMPDCHQGYGMPIGGVMATQDVIVPNCVGVDIGCGICAVRTFLTEINTDTLKEIIGKIREVIPVGFNKHKEKLHSGFLPTYKFDTDSKTCPIVYQEWDNARKSIGTLGGGNHFIEIQKGSDGYIWIMIHSGSRNLGYKVAKHYNEIAKKLNKEWFSSVPEKYELAFLPIKSKEGKAYLREMKYCIEFAFANRKLMMQRIIEIFCNQFNIENVEDSFDKLINIAHNYVSLENHFGKNVWVHRKGATLAKKGTIGIIPGSQGTKSYIVEGLGNPDSFMSCSHGAGRIMGRNQARKDLNLKEQQDKLDKQGIIHSIRGIEDLDEAPDAYKDISQVMENQKDLVKVLVELSPLAVIKG